MTTGAHAQGTTAAHAQGEPASGRATLPRLVIPVEGLVGLATSALTLLFLIYTFIGLQPFVTVDLAARVDGSPLDRLYSLAMAGLALVVVALRWRLSLMLLRRSWLIWLVAAWCVASIGWSAFPGLTLRRSLLLVILTLVPFAIAVGTRNLYRLHTGMMLFLAAVMVINIVGTVVFPAYAITDIGVRGLYSQKNAAGMVAMVTIFVTATWLMTTQRRLHLAIGGCAFLLAAIFLAMTQSKTSAGLAVAMLISVPVLIMLMSRGAGMRRALLIAALAFLAASALVILASGLSRDAVLTILVGDPTFTQRTYIWEFAWSEIVTRPWLGSGYGAFWDVGADHDPLLRVPFGNFLSQIDLGIVNQAHNGYLDLWLQAGLPAVILAVAASLQSTWIAFRLCLQAGVTRFERAGFLLFLMIMLVYVLSNFMEATLFARGLLLNNIAMLVMFLLHRVALDEAIGRRLDAAA